MRRNPKINLPQSFTTFGMLWVRQPSGWGYDSDGATYTNGPYRIYIGFMGQNLPVACWLVFVSRGGGHFIHLDEQQFHTVKEAIVAVQSGSWHGWEHKYDRETSLRTRVQNFITALKALKKEVQEWTPRQPKFAAMREFREKFHNSIMDKQLYNADALSDEASLEFNMPYYFAEERELTKDVQAVLELRKLVAFEKSLHETCGAIQRLENELK